MKQKNLLFLIFVVCFSYGAQANSCLGLFEDNKSVNNELTGVLNPKIFKGNDIRGVFLEDFNFDFPKTLGKALVSFSEKQLLVSHPKILIGHDARLSSPELTKILSDQLIQQGATVSVVGLVPSPLAYFLLHHYNYTMTVVVTASHNPSEYNGFKIMTHNKYQRYNIISDVENIIQKRDFLEDRNSGYEVKLDPYTPYIQSLKKEFPSLKPIPFVVDAGNGAVGPLAKKVFKSLGLNPHYLYTEPDGTFPNHHPDPIKESNLKDLKEQVKKTNSVFGVGFDGDGDRLGIVTSQNKLISSDEFAYMFLPSLFKDPLVFKTLIADVKVSNWYYEKAKEMGAKVIMVRTGYSSLRENMAKTWASLAMELSGHIMFNDRKDRGFDDALYNSLRFIELIGNEKGTIERLLPKVDTVKTSEIRLKLENVAETLNKVKNYLDKNKESYVDIDGIRFTRGKSWGLARGSQTEPVLSLRFEAPNKKEVLNLIKEFSQVMEIEIPAEKIRLY